MKKTLFMLLLGLACLRATNCFSQVLRTPRTPQEDVVLFSLPESVVNTELLRPGARTIKLSDYAGKPIVINLFATWCGPCRFESPDLARLYKEFNSRGLVVIELSTENPELTKESVREWVWKFRLPHIVGWAPPDVALTLMQGRNSIPQTFVVAPDRRIVKRFIGYSPTRSLDGLREAVEEVLREPRE